MQEVLGTFTWRAHVFGKPEIQITGNVQQQAVVMM